MTPSYLLPFKQAEPGLSATLSLSMISIAESRSERSPDWASRIRDRPVIAPSVPAFRCRSMRATGSMRVTMLPDGYGSVSLSHWF